MSRAQSYELIGSLSEASLAQVNLDITVLGVDAVDPVLGAMTHHEGEASVNRHLASRARRLVEVADSTKLGATAFGKICDPGAIDVLITEQDPGEGVRAAWAEHGVEVAVAGAAD